MANSLHDQDAALLAGIFGPPSSAGERWSFVRRHGRVLLACRRDHASLTSALKLYQPQRPAARLVRQILAAGAAVGAVKWLPTAAFTAAADRPVAHLENQFDVRIPALLLGNPTQTERRAILLAEGHPNGPLVFKLGTHPAAVAAIRRESEFLGRWGGHLAGIPALAAESSTADWQAFAIPFLDGEGVDASDLSTVTAILTGWLMQEAPRAANEFAAWRMLDATRFAGPGRTLQLVPSIVHHDLAPWNLIKTRDGQVVAIDWENGASAGVPGWDLIHYLFQTGHLVKRLPTPALLEWLQQALDHPAASLYLSTAGWGENFPYLIASYLAQRVATGDDDAREALAMALTRL